MQGVCVRGRCFIKNLTGKGSGQVEGSVTKVCSWVNGERERDKIGMVCRWECLCKEYVYLGGSYNVYVGGSYNIKKQNLTGKGSGQVEDSVTKASLFIGERRERDKIGMVC